MNNDELDENLSRIEIGLSKADPKSENKAIKDFKWTVAKCRELMAGNALIKKRMDFAVGESVKFRMEIEKLKEENATVTKQMEAKITQQQHQIVIDELKAVEEERDKFKQRVIE